MMPSFTLGLAMLPFLSAAYLVDPPSTAAPDTIVDCTYWQVATDTDTCASISAYWGLTVTQFTTYNPSLANDCGLTVGNSYCIEQNWGVTPPTSTTSSSVTSTSQTPTPTPTTTFGICEAEAGGYKRYCARCLSRCANESTYIAQCFNSVFGTINYYDSQCWQHGGVDCANKAVDIVCPQK